MSKEELVDDLINYIMKEPEFTLHQLKSKIMWTIAESNG